MKKIFSRILSIFLLFTLSLGFFSGYANEENMSEQSTVSASVDGVWKKIAAFLSSQIKENKENKKGKEKKACSFVALFGSLLFEIHF